MIGSVAGVEVYPGGAGYTAAKHAVNALTRTLRLELLGKPIRVTEVAPGLVETEFSLVRFDGDEEKATKVYEGLEPLTAEDVAETVAFVRDAPTPREHRLPGGQAHRPSDGARRPPRRLSTRAASKAPKRDGGSVPRVTVRDRSVVISGHTSELCALDAKRPIATISGNRWSQLRCQGHDLVAVPGEGAQDLLTVLSAPCLKQDLDAGFVETPLTGVADVLDREHVSLALGNCNQ